MDRARLALLGKGRRVSALAQHEFPVLALKNQLALNRL
jgi:hypothetical protein